MSVQIIVHRGTAQIGGCCTEIATGKTRVFIDMGQELPAPGVQAKPLVIDGLTQGEPNCDGVFFTHYHGDHVGQYHRVLPGVPLFMGEAARKILTLYEARVAAHDPMSAERLTALEGVRALRPACPVQVGDIKVLPLAVDHSAYDSYMFLVEAEGKRILHTGDYRLHGFRGKGVLTALKKYVGPVDLLITEGTALSRLDGETVTERDVEMRAMKLMRGHRYTFALCSSTNIDRLAALAAAAKKAGRLFVCDPYQKDVLEIATQYGGRRSPLYDFSGALTYGRNLLPAMRERGFCMPVRTRAAMEQFDPKECVVIYSMWHGYLDREPKLRELIRGYEMVELHAGGHGSAAQIKAVCDAVSPKGVILIHTEVGQELAERWLGYPVFRVADGQGMAI